jgi:RNA polymerase sigma-70 factor (ECF subfamily)
MLGSMHDAEDALQEAMLRAWRAERFEIEDGYASPDARYEQREAVELAFIAALQLLPATQRAVLILREVLGFSAKEAAETLETTTASVNSALQRARATVDDKLPEQSQQETLRALGDDEVRELVESYVDAWERDDVEKVVSMLTEDAAFTMPPLASWFRGPVEIRQFLADSPMSGDWDWRTATTTANGQPAIGYYTWQESDGAYTPFALNVLTLGTDGKIASVDAFIARSPADPDPEKILRLPDDPPDERKVHDYFEAFGLPLRLERD